LKAHPSLCAYTGSIPQYLKDYDIAGQLFSGNVEIIKPLR